MTSKKSIQEIEQILLKASICEDTDERNQYLAAARQMSEKCLQSNPEESDCWFMAGLVYYESITVDEAYGAQTEAYLKNAINLNREHQFAWLYLGHYYYDVTEYEKALFSFEKVKEDVFFAEDRAWRVLKLHELILCCKLRLNQDDIKAESFISLLKEFDRFPDEDIAVPLEMAVTLAETKDFTVWQRINRKQMLNLFIKYLEKSGLKEALSDYLDRF